MARGVAFGEQTARRLVDKLRAGEASPRDERGHLMPPLAGDDHRFFELTEELSGGAGETATCKWLWWNTEVDDFIDSGETGEVLDALGNAWGLEGERGEARFLGGKWIVSNNPGQPVYEGTAAADISAAATTANVNVVIGTDTRVVSCNVPDDAIGTGKKYTSGDRLFIAHSRGAFRIVSFVECEATA